MARRKWHVYRDEMNRQEFCKQKGGHIAQLRQQIEQEGHGGSITVLVWDLVEENTIEVLATDG